MNTIKIFLIVLSLVISRPIFGQDREFKNSPLQISFVYPFGSHGVKSIDYSYKFSFNILTGSTGSIDGFELGGLLNMNKSSVSGFQVGGLGNLTGGNVKGFQVGGLFNLADNLDGLQVSGIFGKTSESDGLQVSGILNISTSAKTSIAGIANINTGTQNGLQAAGIYNQAKELKGLQIGLINLSDTVSKGIPIGLINLVKKGYYDEWSLSVADYMNLGFSYKLGLKKFYTIYTIGMNYIEDQLWVGGLGIGHLHDVNQKFAIQPEMIWYTYFPVDLHKRIRETYINHFKLGFVRTISPTLAISLAPSVYLAWKYDAETYDQYGYEQSPIDPLVDVERANSNKMMEFGFGLSLELHFSNH